MAMQHIMIPVKEAQQSEELLWNKTNQGNCRNKKNKFIHKKDRKIMETMLWWLKIAI